MKTQARLLAAALAVLAASSSTFAALRFVDVNSASPTAPYTNWATAATVIQDAVDIAVAGDEIVVTNGVYATGGRAVDATVTNRVAVDKALTVRSLNGSELTIIQGSQASGGGTGTNAVRCVYLTNGAALYGFTLTNGATPVGGRGGGVECESATAVVSNCVVAGNSAGTGGGAYGGTLQNCKLLGNSSAYSGGGAAACVLDNCAVSGNSAAGFYGGGGVIDSTLSNCSLSGNSTPSDYGGGASRSTLNNCTLTGNSAIQSGGGAYASVLNNSIAFYNTAPAGPNYDRSCSFNNSCTTPLPAAGTGNLSVEPGLASFSHLGAGSPCIGQGNGFHASGVDIDGETWADPPSMGCDEYRGSTAGPLSVALVVSYTNVATAFAVEFQALISGQVSASSWDFGDGTVLSNRPYASHCWSAPGDYSVSLRAFNDENPGGVTATVTVQVSQAAHYVALSNATPVAPYNSWETAATNIQDAVDAAAVVGATVLVSNGVYATGSRTVGTNLLQHRLVVQKPVMLLSVNGPAATTIKGYRVPGTTNGNTAVRCVYLAEGAVLAGFTVTNGATRTTGDYYADCSGGGIWCESTRAVITNCVLNGNAAAFWGGGAYSGTLLNCAVTRNSASYGAGACASWLTGCTITSNRSSSYGGGAYTSTLKSCILSNNVAGSGGGADSSLLEGCTLGANSGGSGAGACLSVLTSCSVLGNSATSSGGGASGGTLSRCLLTGNTARQGGGSSGGTLNNCTITNNSANLDGGGASGGTLNNCIVFANSAVREGGGASSSTLNSCALNANSAAVGGGTSRGTLNNCTLTGNRATSTGGGSHLSELNNCIVYFNSAPKEANYADATLSYCCTSPMPTNGLGNISLDPGLISAIHLSAASPCLGSGSYAFVSGLDIDGEPWANPPSIGCDEFGSGAVTGALAVAMGASYTNVAVGSPVEFQANISGRVSAFAWDFADGTIVSNRLYASHAWSAAGDYAVRLRAYNATYPDGVTATMVIHVVTGVYYVAASNLQPTPPYSSWETAATNIQDAVDVAVVGGQVLVDSGDYLFGGRAGPDGIASRVVVDRPLSLKGVQGPDRTFILGARSGVMTRCVYLAKDSCLSGFTLTNGGSGGAYCESLTVVVSNCVLTGNSSSTAGGGASGGTLINCQISGNSGANGGGVAYASVNGCLLTTNLCSAYGGGAYNCQLTNCTLTGNDALGCGGGAAYATLHGCVLVENGSGSYGTTGGGGGAYQCTLTYCNLRGNEAYAYGADNYGGGAYGGSLDHCSLTGNRAYYGGGVWGSAVNNCAFLSNSAAFSGGGAGAASLTNCTLVGNSSSSDTGGAYVGTLNNCIVYFNTAPSIPNYQADAVNYCCTTPQPATGIGNIAAPPLFVDLATGNLQLHSNSPCINAGNNAFVVGGTDLAGNPRISGGTIDIGAYEFQSGGLNEFASWLQRYGLPTDGSADYIDSDADGMNNWQEWRCQTDPTNALSALRLLSAAPAGNNIAVSWQSVAGVRYFLECGTNLQDSPCFLPLASGIIGQPGTTTFTHTNPVNPTHLFYRVGVGQ